MRGQTIVMNAEYHDFLIDGKFSFGLKQGMQQNPLEIVDMWKAVKDGWAIMELETVASFRMDPKTLTINIISVENGYDLLASIFPDLATRPTDAFKSMLPMGQSKSSSSSKSKTSGSGMGKMGLAEFFLLFKRVARELNNQKRTVILQHKAKDLCKFGYVNSGPLLTLLGVPNFEISSKLRLVQFISKVFTQ